MMVCKVDPSIAYTVHDPRVMPVTECGCWLWIGPLGTDGYGRARLGGRKTSAHRRAFERARGVIPAGLHLDHTCRVRACVNPDHLRAVTPRVNAIENSSSPIALNAAKIACGACAGPFKHRGGRRVCAACEREATRRYKERQRARERAA